MAAQQVGDDVVADAERPWLDQPTKADHEPPSAGHHIQWIGSRSNRSSQA